MKSGRYHTYHFDCRASVVLRAIIYPNDVEQWLGILVELTKNRRSGGLLIAGRVKGVNEILAGTICNLLQEVLNDGPLVLGGSPVEMNLEVDFRS